MKKTSHFWVSFGDLMTTLFFLMLVLFAICSWKGNSMRKEVESLKSEIEFLRNENIVLENKTKKIQEMEQIQKAVQSLPKDYFEFDTKNNRHRLKVDCQFEQNSSDISTIGSQNIARLVTAGKALKAKLDSVTKANPDINYLLIIEGNTARSEKLKNWENIPEIGYDLSYKRALALQTLFENTGIDFRKNKQVEVMLVGSGYFSRGRDTIDELNNMRFTMQITPKLGEYLSQ